MSNASGRCEKHPSQAVIGICGSCLRERLAALPTLQHKISPISDGIAGDNDGRGSSDGRSSDQQQKMNGREAFEEETNKTLWYLFNVEDEKEVKQIESPRKGAAAEDDCKRLKAGEGKRVSWLHSLLGRKASRRWREKRGSDALPQQQMEPNQHMSTTPFPAVVCDGRGVRLHGMKPPPASGWSKVFITAPFKYMRHNTPPIPPAPPNHNSCLRASAFHIGGCSSPAATPHLASPRGYTLFNPYFTPTIDRRSDRAWKDHHNHFESIKTLNFSPNNINSGLLRFYLTPLRNKGKSKRTWM